MSDYKCAECGREVKVEYGKLVKQCGHKDAYVIAVMTAVTTGIGTAE